MVPANNISLDLMCSVGGKLQKKGNKKLYGLYKHADYYCTIIKCDFVLKVNIKEVSERRKSMRIWFTVCCTRCSVHPLL